MNIEKVIYIDGQMGIESTVYTHEDGKERIAYTGYLRKLEKDMPLADYLAEKPGAVCLSFDEALKRISEVEEKAYIKPWVEISADAWTEALEVLPPEKWKTVNGVELFRISERTTGNITAHYARIGARHFSASRRTSAAYEKLAQEVKEVA